MIIITKKTDLEIMKGLKSLKLPNWLIKSIQHGKENEKLSSIFVDIGIFYLLGLVIFFACSSFGSEYLAIEIICTVGVLLLLVMFGCWLTGQVTLLDSLREEALVLYGNSKTLVQKREAVSRLEKLKVPVPTAA
jgi:hypothetical protein